MSGKHLTVTLALWVDDEEEAEGLVEMLRLGAVNELYDYDFDVQGYTIDGN